MADHLSPGSEFPRKAKAVPAVRPGRLVSYNESGCGEAQPPIPTFADGRHLSRDWRPLRITLEADNILIHREFLDTRDSLSVAHTFKNCASENHWSYSRCLICLSDFTSCYQVPPIVRAPLRHPMARPYHDAGKVAPRRRSEVSRCQREPPSVTDISISAWPSIRPLTPLSKRSRSRISRVGQILYCRLSLANKLVESV